MSTIVRDCPRLSATVSTIVRDCPRQDGRLDVNDSLDGRLGGSLDGMLDGNLIKLALERHHCERINTNDLRQQSHSQNVQV